jgi:hypothetical protein
MITQEQTASTVEQKLRQCVTILNETIRIVRDRCPPEEFHVFRRSAAPIMGAIYLDLLKPIYADHPSLSRDDQQKDV